MRAKDGTITTFDASSATGTYPNSINTAGDIAGIYTDASGTNHGFVRAASGTITTFDAPGAGTGGGDDMGTDPNSINTAGVISGYYVDAGFTCHGFVRAANGTITTFDAPGAGGMGYQYGTLATSISTAGDIAGGYTDPSLHRVSHGFVRTPTATTKIPRITRTSASGLHLFGAQ